jgi:UDPglucose 6-dehydrogenase
MKIAIIGVRGWVGKAMYSVFPDAYRYDLNEGTIDGVNECDIAFICTPTPLKQDGSLDISIVEECVSWCKCSLIVIRSTLQPGTSDYFEKKYNKNIVMQPEYLGETVAHPLFQESQRPFLIIGGRPENRRKVIELYQSVYNANVKIRQVTNLEAEVIKLSENRAIAFKVMQAQELYDACERAGVDYYTIRDAVYGDDPRFNLWFTFIYTNNRGFNSSKCLRKDVPAWCAWAESLGYKPTITQSLVDKSNDYELLKGF